MNISKNKYDAIEALIFEEGLKIVAVSFNATAEFIFIRLNTNAVLKQRVAEHELLRTASPEELENFEIIADGTGIHWNSRDEDLSLKGFLENEIRNLVKIPTAA